MLINLLDMNSFFCKKLVVVFLLLLCYTHSNSQERRLYGLSAHWWFVHNWNDPNDPDRLNKFIDEYKALGVNVIRLGLDWQVIEPKYGQRLYGDYKKMVDELKASGIEVILLFYTAPKYMVNKESLYQDMCCPETNKWCAFSELRRDSVRAFNKVVKDVVNHFSNVTYWEFWNEPQYDGSMGRPEEFAFWFSKFRRKVKNQNANAKISMGTIYANDNQNDITEQFVKDVHSHLTVSDYPDAISLHPYQRFIGDTSRSYANINQSLVRAVHNDFPAAKIWITEYGWDLRQGFTSEQQARGIKNALTWITSKNYIQFATYHMMHDWDGWDECNLDSVQQSMGLVNKAFLKINKGYKRKLAWCAFHEQATGEVLDCPVKVVGSSVSQDEDLGASSMESLKYYPNPVNDVFVIEINLDGDLIAVEIEDAMGQKYYPVSDQESNTLSINTSLLSRGTYILKVQTSLGTVVRRFVKE